MRFCRYCPGLAFLLGLTAQIQGAEPPHWEDWQRAASYADRVTAPGHVYFTRQVEVATGSQRGGAVRGSWIRNDLVLMTFTVGLPSKDVVDRFVCIHGKIVAAEQFEIAYNAATHRYGDRTPRKFRRFLLTHYKAVCQENPSAKQVRDLTPEEREQLPVLLHEFYTFRDILWKKGRTVDGAVALILPYAHPL